MQASIDKCKSCEENGHGGEGHWNVVSIKSNATGERRVWSNGIKVENTRRGVDCAIREHKREIRNMKRKLWRRKAGMGGCV